MVVDKYRIEETVVEGGLATVFRARHTTLDSLHAIKVLHVHSPALIGRLISEGDAGNKVHQVLANYQALENGGNGWLRTLKFMPDENEIRVTAYSPTLDEFNRDGQHTFALAYDMGASKSRP